MSSAPIILTATMAKHDFDWADAMRKAHYPADRNVIDAHITLFHHLSPSLEAEILQRMKAHCAAPAPAATVSGVLNLGRGVAYRVESPGLLAIRQHLAEAFAGMLTPQDAHTPRLHITIQNKVAPDVARALFDRLSSDFVPRALGIAGLAAWYYRAGPWELIRAMPFRR